MCPNFQWIMQGETFSTEVRLLPLGGYNMILGVQWMREVGHVTLDMQQLTLGVIKNNHKVILQAGGRTDIAL